jgi:Uncharacterized protein conserved in bacteria (DUF2125)
MTRMLACSTALSLFLAADAAMAEVTPEEVWANWQALATAAGQQLTFDNVAQNGDSLDVTGLVLTYTDDLGGSFSANIDKMGFKGNGDGTVGVTMSESFPMTMAFPADTEGPSAMKLTVTQPGLLITAGGSATETKYDFTAPSVSVVLDEVKDQAGAVMDTEASLMLTDSVASYLVAQSGETTALDSSFSAKSLTMTLSGTDPAGPGDAVGSGTVTLSLADLGGSTKGNLLGAEIMANMATALNSGFTSDTNMAFGAMSFDANITEAAGPTVIKGAAAGGDFVLAVDKVRVNYGSSLKGASFTVSGAQIPFPEVVVGFAETAFNVLIPASKSDTPQDFAYLTKIVDLTISDDVWGLFDPAASLSREPATFILDAKGTGRWFQDIMDPAVEMDGVEPPGQIDTLDLTQLLVKAAGAEVAATGALTVDNSGATTFQGMPAPTGTINVDIKGVNKLIDNLIAMGILPDDQAMGARMMLGMFTRPGAGPDEVTSLIEFKDGGLFANGQQLQ